MRRLFAAMFIIPLGFLVFVAVPRVHAKPAYFDCTILPCDSYGTWNGNNHGGETTFTTSDPGFYTTHGVFLRDLVFQNGEAYAEIGIIKWETTGTGVCRSSTSVQFYFEVFNTNGSLLKQACANIPNVDINLLVTFKVGRFTSGGGGVFGEITDLYGGRTNFNNCPNPCFVTGASQVYGDERLDEEIVDHVTGHQVWGVQWIDTQFQNPNTDELQYQAKDFGPEQVNDPPQFYWNIVPMLGNNGGQLYSCDYDTGTTCTLGSILGK